MICIRLWLITLSSLWSKLSHGSFVYRHTHYTSASWWTIWGLKIQGFWLLRRVFQWYIFHLYRDIESFCSLMDTFIRHKAVEKQTGRDLYKNKLFSVVHYRSPDIRLSKPGDATACWQQQQQLDQCNELRRCSGSCPVGFILVLRVVRIYELTIDLLRAAGYSPGSGHRSLHTPVVVGGTSAGDSGTSASLADDRDFSGGVGGGPHQSATAAAVAAAAAVRKTCLAGSHASSAPWRPQGKRAVLALCYLTLASCIVHSLPRRVHSSWHQ